MEIFERMYDAEELVQEALDNTPDQRKEGARASRSVVLHAFRIAGQRWLDEVEKAALAVVSRLGYDDMEADFAPPAWANGPQRIKVYGYVSRTGEGTPVRRGRNGHKIKIRVGSGEVRTGPAAAAAGEMPGMITGRLAGPVEAMVDAVAKRTARRTYMAVDLRLRLCETCQAPLVLINGVARRTSVVSVAEDGMTEITPHHDECPDLRKDLS